MAEVEAILGAVPLPMVLVGDEELIVTANPAGQALLGPGQVGRHHAIGLRQPALLAAIGAALRDGIPGQAPYAVTGPAQASYHVTVTPIAHAGGRAVLLAFQDITEQERITAFRRDFVANVSHELRSPLTTLVGLIDTLKGAAKDDPAARARFLDIMQQEAARMARLVRDLLSLSKAEAEERRRPTAPVDIAALVRGVADTLRPLADSAGTVLAVDAPETLPPIPGDADRLVQVLRNLIENAITYDTRGRRVTVTLDPGAGQPMLRIDVTDRGEGIEPQHLPRLTERFYRVDGHRGRAQGGTGLGLAIVKHIVARHRGRLAISSHRGQGTRVSVFLPKS